MLCSADRAARSVGLHQLDTREQRAHCRHLAFVLQAANRAANAKPVAELPKNRYHCTNCNVAIGKLMSDPRSVGMNAIEGLRERKRRQTRARIAEVAMELFLKRGFDATTVDDIAASADVSKRSFFDYFPTKEGVVAAWQDDFGTALAAAVRARPRAEPLARVLEEAMTSAIVGAAHPRAIAIDQLICDTPALSARDHLKYAELEETLGGALAERVSGDAGQLRAQLLAMIAIGGLRVGSAAWRAQGRTGTTEARTRNLFGAVWAELRGFGGPADERDKRGERR